MVLEVSDLSIGGIASIPLMVSLAIVTVCVVAAWAYNIVQDYQAPVSFQAEVCLIEMEESNYHSYQAEPLPLVRKEDAYFEMSELTHS